MPASISDDLSALSALHGLTDIAPRIDLKDRVIVITGAAAGIGEAVARGACLYGAHVIGIDVQEEKLRVLSTELGSSFTPLAFDLAQPIEGSSFEDRLYAAVLGKGQVDGYLMNAGVVRLSNASSLAEMPAQELEALFRINVASHHEIFRILYPFLKASSAGRIVATSSPIVGRSDPATLGYALTKRALQDLAAHMHRQAQEDGDNDILVTGYVPPPVQNFLCADLKPTEPFAATPLPVDVAELPLRLLSARLPQAQNGEMYVFVDKRTKIVTPQGLVYRPNKRTERGFDLGLRVRTLNCGGGAEGAAFQDSYDTGEARLLLGEGPAPPLNERRTLGALYPAPAHIQAYRAPSRTASSSETAFAADPAVG